MPGVKATTNRTVANVPKKIRRRKGATSHSASIASAAREKDRGAAGGGRENARAEAAPGAAGCTGKVTMAPPQLTPRRLWLDTPGSAIESNWDAKNAGSPKSSATSASS